MQGKKILKIVSLVVLVLIILPKKVSCESAGLYLNEIMWRGSSVSSADEWIEIINTSDHQIDLTGYSLFDEMKGEKILEIKDFRIEPLGLLLIANNKEDYIFSGGESVLNVNPDIVDSSLSLSNSAFQISLRDQSSQVIDIAGNGLSGFFPKTTINYYSLQRINYSRTQGEDPKSWRLSSESTNIDEGREDINIATPRSLLRGRVLDLKISDNFVKIGQPKRIQFTYDYADINGSEIDLEISARAGRLEYLPVPDVPGNEFDLPKADECWQIDFRFKIFKEQQLFTEDLNCFLPNKKILFSEILTNPKMSDWNEDGLVDDLDEWIELVNESTVDADLNNWLIRDASGKQVKLSGNIAAGKFILVSMSKLLLQLNNNGESLYLYDPSGELVDLVKIPSLTSDQSYSKINGSWHKTDKPTPGSVNLLNEEIKPIQERAVGVQKTEQTIQVISKPVISVQQDQELTIVKTVQQTKIPTVFAVIRGDDFSNVRPIDSQKILGDQSQRLSNPLIINRNLLYFISVLSIFSVTSILIVIINEIYRRE